ncbi:MAG: phage holin family protein [Pseudonocardiales bacterium]
MSLSSASTRSESSIGSLVSEASRDLSLLISKEIELAKTELRVDVANAAKAGVMFGVAAVFGVFLMVMLLIALAEGLVAAGLWRWAAYLVVAAVLAVLAGIVAIIGLRSVKRLGPPQRTISTAKETLAWAKHPTQQPVTVVTDGHHTAEAVPPSRKS